MRGRGRGRARLAALGLWLLAGVPALALARPPGRMPPVATEQAAPAAPAAPTYAVRLADLQRKVDQLKEQIWRQPPRLPSYHPLHPDGPTSQGQRRAARLR